MNPADLQKRLQAAFLEELQDHCEGMTRALLVLESEEDPVEPVRELFRSAHSLKGAARAVGAGPLEALAHAAEEALRPARDAGARPDEELRKLLVRCVDAFGAGREHLLDDVGAELPEAEALLEELLSSAHLPEEESREPAPSPRPESLARTPAAGPRPSRESTGRVSGRELEALDRARSLQLLTRQRLGSDRDALLQVSEQWKQLLREIAPRIGPDEVELVEEWGRRFQHVSESFRNHLAEHARAAETLEEGVHAVSMIPFAEACAGLERTVLELVQDQGKSVEVRLAGEGVRIDRPVVRALRTPLLHLVRNAVDHGVELPEIREARGKPRRATLEIRAWRREGGVVVEVVDDGQGIDPEGVARRSRELGFPEPRTPEELTALLCTPGFTTREEADEVSGRGVGLDLVSGKLEEIHGTLRVDSEPGKGTRVELGFPVSLSSFPAVIAESAGHLFALPSSNVERLLRVDEQALTRIENGLRIRHEGEALPVSSLAGLLGLPCGADAAGDRVHLVLLRAGERRLALRVGALADEGPVVLKQLGSRLSGLTHMAGATVLADGRTAFVLRGSELVRMAFGTSASAAIGLDRRPLQPPLRVLLVDDTLTTRLLQQSLLEEAGHRVMLASNGLEAWDRLGRSPVDLVVSDVEMPGMDGIGLTQRIRRSPRLRDLPVVLVSHLESDEDRSRGLQAGADAYIRKSRFDPAELLQWIARHEARGPA